MIRYTALFAAVFLLSCQPQSKEQMIVGEWQGVEMHNAEMEQLLKAQKELLDTLGKHTPEAEYERAFGVRNLDSFRQAGYKALEEMKDYVRKSAPLTRFRFRSDGVAVFSYPEGTDSAHYKIEEDSVLVLNERSLKTVGTERLEMFIDTLTKDALQIRFTEKAHENTMKFRKISIR